MEETNEIGKIITKVLNSEFINRYEYRDRDGCLDDYYAKEAILYCIIMRDSQIPEDFNITGKILCKKIAKKLNIDEELVDERQEDIINYIYNNLFKDGFCFHVTNSFLAENIRKEGLHGLKNTRMSSDISEIYEMMSKYEGPIYSLFTFSGPDLDDNRGFFYSDYVGSIYKYLYSPEWLKFFCKGVEANCFNDGKVDAFERRDYDRIKQGIQLLINQYNISEQDAKKLTSFIDKYWKMFEKSKPMLILIPRNSLGLDDYGFKDFYEDWVSDEIEDNELTFDKNNREIYFKIDTLLKCYKIHMSNRANLDCKSNISPADLSFVDLSQLLPEEIREKIQEAERTKKASEENIQNQFIQKTDEMQDIEVGQRIYLGGTGEMYLCHDSKQKEYLYKPGLVRRTQIPDKYKIASQVVASNLQKKIDPQSAISINYFMDGTIQEKIPINVEKTKQLIEFQDGTKELDLELMKGLMREYVIDYLLCNYDSHPKNFIVGTDGILRGVDKEQSFKYIEHEESEDPTFSYNFNARYGERPSIYSTIFERIAQGKMSPDVLDYMNEFVEKAMQISNEEYLDIIRPYCMCFSKLQDSDENADLKKYNYISNLILSRKENLEKTMQTMKTDLREKYNIARQHQKYTLNDLVGLTRGVDPEKRAEAFRVVEGLEQMHESEKGDIGESRK